MSQVSSQSAGSLVAPLLLAHLWLNATSRGCLLQYMLAIDACVGAIQPAGTASPMYTHQWQNFLHNRCHPKNGLALTPNILKS